MTDNTPPQTAPIPAPQAPVSNTPPQAPSQAPTISIPEGDGKPLEGFNPVIQTPTPPTQEQVQAQAPQAPQAPQVPQTTDGTITPQQPDSSIFGKNTPPSVDGISQLKSLVTPQQKPEDSGDIPVIWNGELGQYQMYNQALLEVPNMFMAYVSQEVYDDISI